MQFLAFLDTAAQGDSSRRKRGAPEAVSILSIHKSKGLEYPVVFLSNLCCF